MNDFEALAEVNAKLRDDYRNGIVHFWKTQGRLPALHAPGDANTGYREPVRCSPLRSRQVENIIMLGFLASRKTEVTQAYVLGVAEINSKQRILGYRVLAATELEHVAEKVGVTHDFSDLFSSYT